MNHTEEKFGRETQVIPVDFSGGLEIYTMINDQLSDLDIGVLGEFVNDAVRKRDVLLIISE